MKILVTGGAGFVGSHLVDWLMKKGHRVTVYDNLKTGHLSFLTSHLKDLRFQFIKNDVLNSQALKKALKGQDMVFHASANSDIIKAMKSPNLDFKQGILATFRLLEAMIESGVKKLVYFSGSGVYGDFGSQFMHEDLGPLNPKSMYGAAKLSSEGMISAFSHLYGFQAWIFRPANIIGGRPTHGVIYDFIQKLNKNPNEIKILGDGTQSKSYIHITDVVDGILFVLENTNRPLNQFNIATESYITVREIAEMVCAEMGLDRARLIFGKSERGWIGDVPKYRLDIKKIKSLGWKPKLNTRQAVMKTIHEILVP